jgi:hypothetical protein
LDKKANESAKYKGKKEKRVQRATFREIYNSFEVEFKLKKEKNIFNEISSYLGRYITRIYNKICSRSFRNNIMDRKTLLQWF